jgi:aminotransferase EvaB
VLVDCDDRFQIDISQIEKKISKKTRAILPVHWAGAPCEIDKIVSIAKKYKIDIVEDACPAVGGHYKGKNCGTFGIVNAFSMHPLKPLNVWGDGGVIVTNNKKIYEFLKLYRNHGLRDREHVDIWGINNRLQPFQAVIGARSLDSMESYIKARNNVAKIYDAAFEKIKQIKIPKRLINTREVFQLYKIRVKKRNQLIKFLEKNNIDCSIHYPIPIHLQKAAKNLKYKKGDFKNTELQAKEIITLPCHQFLTKKQVNFVIKKIQEFYEK